MKVAEQYFPVVQFIMLGKKILSLEYLDKTLRCDRSNESSLAVPFCGTTVQPRQHNEVPRDWKMCLL